MNNYTDNIINETGQGLALMAAKNPLNSAVYYTSKPVSVLEKPVLKAVNGYGLAQLTLAANDAVEGYNGAKEIFQAPSTTDRVATAIANAGSGIVFGAIPVDKAAIGLAQLLGSDSIPVSAVAEEAHKEANEAYTQKVRENVLKNITSKQE